MELYVDHVDVLALADLNLCPFCEEKTMKTLIEDFNGECKILYEQCIEKINRDDIKNICKTIQTVPYDLSNLNQLEEKDLGNVRILLVDVEALNKKIAEIKGKFDNIKYSLYDKEHKTKYFVVQIGEKSITESIHDIFEPLFIIPSKPAICHDKKGLFKAFRRILDIDLLKPLCREVKSREYSNEYLRSLLNKDMIEEIIKSIRKVGTSMDLSEEEIEKLVGTFVSTIAVNFSFKPPKPEDIETFVKLATKETIIAEARDAVLNFDEIAAQEIAQKTVCSKTFPAEIVKVGFIDAMAEITKKYEVGNISKSSLLEASRVQNIGMNTLEPRTVLLSTFKDETNSIMTDIIPDILKSEGYKVLDLGRDVRPQYLVDRVKETSADIIVFHTFENTDIHNQKAFIELLEKENIRNNVKVMVYGEPVTKVWAEEIGAEIQAKNAYDAISELNINYSASFTTKGSTTRFKP